MDTIGKIFKTTREKQKYTIREIAEQTKIGSRYLSALEEDRYTAFPSQTHITGFIRSYAKFLELDPERMIDIYKRTIVQETPAPIEELTAQHKPKMKLSILAAVIVAAAAIIVAYMFLSDMQQNQIDGMHPDEDTGTNAHANLSTHVDERFFTLGSFIPLTLDGEEKRLVFDDFTPDTVTVTYAETRYPLVVGRTYVLDLNRDGSDDLRIGISAVSNQRAYGSASILHKKQNTDPLREDAPGSAVGRTILKSAEQTEIRLTISAHGIATVNTVRDNQEQNNYFLKKDDTITVLARDTVQLTASNPHNLLLNLNNINLEVDTRNPAAGFIFKWRQSPVDGLYHLEYEQLR